MWIAILIIFLIIVAIFAVLVALRSKFEKSANWLFKPLDSFAKFLHL